MARTSSPPQAQPFNRQNLGTAPPKAEFCVLAAATELDFQFKHLKDPIFGGNKYTPGALWTMLEHFQASSKKDLQEGEGCTFKPPLQGSPRWRASKAEYFNVK